jgi:hypothetical protein
MNLFDSYLADVCFACASIGQIERDMKRISQHGARTNDINISGI